MRRTMAGKKKSAARARFGGTRGWIAAGTLAAYAVMGGTKSALAEQEKSDPAGSSAAEATLPLKKIDIAAGPLDGAVEARREHWRGSTRRESWDFIAKTRRCDFCWRGQG
jgi:catecholate siderophore receptor